VENIGREYKEKDREGGNEVVIISVSKHVYSSSIENHQKRFHQATLCYNVLFLSYSHISRSKPQSRQASESLTQIHASISYPYTPCRSHLSNPDDYLGKCQDRVEPKERNLQEIDNIYFPFKLTPFTLLANCAESESSPEGAAAPLAELDIEEVYERFGGRSPDSLRIVNNVNQPPDCCNLKPSERSCSAATLWRSASSS